MLFSPELLRGTDLEVKMKDYAFFSYFAIETLKMEPSEWGRITQLLTQLRHELQENDDSESLWDVILGYIRLILEYCAKQMAYSPRYLGDVIHKSTGGTAIGYIHSFVIEQGKSLLMNGHNVGETALLLGFEFPHHFTRLFKKVTGITPTEFLGAKTDG